MAAKGTEQPIVSMENHNGTTEVKILNEELKNQSLAKLQAVAKTWENAQEGFETKIKQLDGKKFSYEFQQYAANLNAEMNEALHGHFKPLATDLRIITQEEATGEKQERASAQARLTAEQAKVASFSVPIEAGKATAPTQKIAGSGNMLAQYAKGNGLEARMKNAGL